MLRAMFLSGKNLTVTSFKVLIPLKQEYIFTPESNKPKRILKSRGQFRCRITKAYKELRKILVKVIMVHVR